MDGATGLQAISHDSLVFVELFPAVDETLHASGDTCPLLSSTDRGFHLRSVHAGNSLNSSQRSCQQLVAQRERGLGIRLALTSMHLLTCLMPSSGCTKTDCTLSKKICILKPWHTPPPRLVFS